MRKLVEKMKIWKASSHNSQAGFTLIEMSIVIIIIGVLLGATAQLYQQRLQYLRTDRTIDSVEDARLAIANFLNMYGRYPCPASLTATDETYGSAAGNCNDGNVYTIAADGYATLTGTDSQGNTETVRVGAIPFKQLNLTDDQAADGYRNRLIYAVTEQMTDQTTFLDSVGGISVKDEKGLETKDVHFIVYSTGEDKIGAFNIEGTQISACNTNNLIHENCNFSSLDATFYAGQLSKGDNNQKLDDYIAFNTHSDMPQWEIVENSEHVNMKLPGSLGILPGAAETPKEELDVAGIIRAQDDLFTNTQEGQIHSRNICGYSGKEGSDCFASALIAGEDQAMKCPPDKKFMTGIRYGQAVCTDKIEAVCPGNSIMTGVNADGSLKCITPGCQSKVVTLCGEEHTLLGGPENTHRRIEYYKDANSFRWEQYKCENGNWVLPHSFGTCECIPEGLAEPYAQDCGRDSSDCGHRYTGQRIRQKRWVCPRARVEYPTIDESGCACDPTSKDTHVENCPEGYNVPGGQQVFESRFDCATETCTPRTLIENTCECKYDIKVEQRSCGVGFGSTTYQVQREWTCPNGGDQPGGWTTDDWVETPGQGKADKCVCQTGTTTRKASCVDTDQIGERIIEVNLTCPDTSQPPVPVDGNVISDTCRDPGEATCVWLMIPSSQTGRGDIGKLIQDGNSCDCVTQRGQSSQCSDNIGNTGDHAYGLCRCTPQP